MDALLIVFADSHSVLIPWDVNLAEQFSSVLEIKPFTSYNRNFIHAVKSVIESKIDSESGRKLIAELNIISCYENIYPDNNTEAFINIHDNTISLDSETTVAVLADTEKRNRKPAIEFSSSASYPLIKKAEKELNCFAVLCREEGSDNYLESIRAIKTEEEINFLKKAGSITDTVFRKLKDYLRSISDTESDLTETDIALFIETEGRKAGAEGTGFETLAAAPERSFSIHPFPSFSDKKAPAKGLTIVDFGHKYEGYTSDVTTTIACGKLTDKQEKMISLVKEATEIFESILAPGISTVDLTKSVTSLFESNGFKMPHALGHGIGLDVHESPVLKDLRQTEIFLRPGMVLAIEPGIYSPESGGVRLENDYLITESGFSKLTNSEIIRL